MLEFGVAVVDVRNRAMTLQIMLIKIFMFVPVDDLFLATEAPPISSIIFIPNVTLHPVMFT